MLHTPGPWHYAGGYMKYDASIVSVLGENNVQIAHLPKFVSNTEANANLIAAAPEMLQALEVARQELRKNWCDTEEEFKQIHAVLLMDATISKAKGANND